MKRFILFTSILVFLATTFESDSPPGWYQQTIPLGNKLITDIHFLDTSNGYVVTDWGPAFDTGYVFKTSNGGINWDFQYRYPGSFTAIQMTSVNTGYITGSTGSGKVWKTTNGGQNWGIQFNFSANPVRELFFINNDTGWVCSDNPLNGGVFKTTNGGSNWQAQLGPTSFIRKIFFINKDTGWAVSDEANSRLHKTTNSGINWNLQFTFEGAASSLFFVDRDTGFVGGGFGSHSIKRTTNGGLSWDSTINSQGGRGLFFINKTIGWNSNIFSIVQKTTDGGKSWYRQTVPSGFYYTITAIDSLKAWAGGTVLIHTSDGGGPPLGIQQISNEVPEEFKIYQNYPNPFNPVTNIKYQIKNSGSVKLVVYDVQGIEITILVNEEQRAGAYEIDWNASEFSSGIYFYSLIIDGRTTYTKKMVLLK